jgi:hypothetical protein
MMSIHHTHKKRPINYDASQIDTRPGAPSAAFRPPNGQGVPLDWVSLRKAQPVHRLLPIGREWLARLPTDVQPTSLAAQYPRIVNVLAVEWANRTACRTYFAQLLVDCRGNRKGFPDAVHRDLLKLQDYYCTPH